MSKELETFEVEFQGEITKEKIEQIYKILGKPISEVTTFVLENIEPEKITFKIKFS